MTANFCKRLGRLADKIASSALPKHSVARLEAMCQRGCRIVMGGSFITPGFGEFPQDVERLAREAGALGANQSYRMYAVLGAPIASIVSQCEQALRDSPVKEVGVLGKPHCLLPAELHGDS